MEEQKPWLELYVLGSEQLALVVLNGGSTLEKRVELNKLNPKHRNLI